MLPAFFLSYIGCFLHHLADMNEATMAISSHIPHRFHQSRRFFIKYSPQNIDTSRNKDRYDKLRILWMLIFLLFFLYYFFLGYNDVLGALSLGWKYPVIGHFLNKRMAHIQAPKGALTHPAGEGSAEAHISHHHGNGALMLHHIVAGTGANPYVCLIQ